jgi:putative transcriptional regulator
MTIHRHPRHHPGDDTLLGHAAAALPQGLSLVVATHLALCPACRTRMAEADAVGGALLDALDPAPLGAGALDGVLARLDEPASETISVTAPGRAQTAVPRPLRDHLEAPLGALRWRPVAPGVRFHPLTGLSSERGAVRLLRVAPGSALPRHGHTGSELTLVLRGWFEDEAGRFAEGDVEDADPGTVHRPVIGGDFDCICLVATDAPLRFDGLLARAAGRLIGL